MRSVFRKRRAALIPMCLASESYRENQMFSILRVRHRHGVVLMAVGVHKRNQITVSAARYLKMESRPVQVVRNQRAADAQLSPAFRTRKPTVLLTCLTANGTRTRCSVIMRVQEGMAYHGASDRSDNQEGRDCDINRNFFVAFVITVTTTVLFATEERTGKKSCHHDCRLHTERQ